MRTACPTSMTKILPSPIAPVFAARLDRLHDAVGHVDAARDLDLQLGHHVGRIFGPAVNLGLALLPPEALDLGHGHAADPDLGQRLAHLIELERFDDCNDQFHAAPLGCVQSIFCNSRANSAPQRRAAFGTRKSFIIVQCSDRAAYLTGNKVKPRSHPRSDRRSAPWAAPRPPEHSVRLCRTCRHLHRVPCRCRCPAPW